MDIALVEFMERQLKQIADAIEGYVVRDDIEYGSGNIIPLWAFGLSY